MKEGRRMGYALKPQYTTKQQHGREECRLEKWVSMTGGTGWVRRTLLIMSDGCVLWKHSCRSQQWPVRGERDNTGKYQTKKALQGHTNLKFRLRGNEEAMKYRKEHMEDGYEDVTRIGRRTEK